MKRSICWALLLVLNVHPAAADSWARPKPKTWTSANQMAAFSTSDPHFGKPCRGVMKLRHPVGETPLWTRLLLNTPARALVTNDGGLVTFDNHGRVGHEHAVVIYGRKGQLIADFRLEDLLSQQDIQRRIPHTVSSRSWASKSSSLLEGHKLVIRWDWGKTTRIDLDSGKLQ